MLGLRLIMTHWLTKIMQDKQLTQASGAIARMRDRFITATANQI